MTTALAFAGALLLLQTLLALNVSLRRLRTKDYKHDTDHPEIRRAQLTHRNAMEHIPLLTLVVVGLALAGAPREWVLGAGACALFARLVHATGYLFPPLAGIRLWGSVLGYTTEVLGCAGVVALAVRAGV